MTEKDVANHAKRVLKDRLRQGVKSQFTERTGVMFEQLDTTSRFSGGKLTRITIKAPRHLFIQNYGFEGMKKNGVSMRLKATNVVDDAISQTDVVNYLADNISAIRADEIVAKIK